jgi:beta-lactamase regulating signal transducer with metallopeptidase domain
MINTLVAEASFLRDVAWQTTALLLVGGIASLCWARQPARAHRLLLLTMVAALVTPLLSQIFRECGWGLFLRPAPSIASDETLTWKFQEAETVNASTKLPARFVTLSAQEVAGLPAATWAVDLQPETAKSVADMDMAESKNPSELAWSWLHPLAVWAWITLTGVVILRLLLGVVQGWRLLAGAQPLADSRLQEALDGAAAKMGIPRAPILRTSDRVVSPVIWCWSRRPILLVPVSAAAGSLNVDWVAVMCHELAHWKRRDHLASFVGQIVVAAIPLQPLAWWAKRRLGHLCERACDDWVLAIGRSSVHYAESLLDLLPQRRPALAMTAVRSRRELPRRIRRILAYRRSNPSLGRWWTMLATSATALMVLAASLAQYRPVSAEEPPAPPAQAKPATTQRKAEAAPAKSKASVEVIVAGKVLGEHDLPLANAEVALVESLDARSPLVLGRAKTDATGSFGLKVRCPESGDRSGWTILATAKGYGLGWAQPYGDPNRRKHQGGTLGLLQAATQGDGKRGTNVIMADGSVRFLAENISAVAKSNQLTVLRLQPEQVLSGRLIGLQGQPASGVKVFVRSVGKQPEPKQNDMRFKYQAVLQTEADLNDDDASDRSDLGLLFRGVTFAYTAVGDFDGDGKVDLLVANVDGTLISQAVPANPPMQFRVPPEGLPFWPGPITTDDQGRFTIRGIGRGQEVGLLVRDERFAVQALELKSPEKDKPGEMTLVLTPARVVEGTVTEAGSGKPLAHAGVRVRMPGSNTSFALNALAFPGNADWKGRHGLGGNLLAFDFVGIGPSGNPLPDIEAQTDEQGRFRLHLYEADSFTLRASAPQGQPYLSATKSINWPKAAARQTVNFSLPRGVPVEGKVMETGGKLVAEARIDFWSKDLKLPEGVHQPKAVKTGKDGTFRTLLLPGTWHLLINGPSSDYLYQKIPAVKLTDEVTRTVLFNPDGKRVPKDGDLTSDPKESFFYPDQWEILDIKPDSKLPPVVITLRRVTLRGRLVAPDGKPVGKARMLLRRELPPPPPAAGATAAGLTSLTAKHLSLDFVGMLPPQSHFNQPVELSDGRFEFPVNDLDTTYRVLFQDAENGLGAVTDFKGKQAEGEPVTVRLVPSGSANARLLDDKGTPLANYRPLIWAMLPPIHAPSLTELGNGNPSSGYCEVWQGQADPKHYGDGPRTDAQGRIAFRNLVPGATYRISQFDGKAKDFTVEAGKAADLGDIRVVKPDETKKLPAIKPATAKSPK